MYICIAPRSMSLTWSSQSDRIVVGTKVHDPCCHKKFICIENATLIYYEYKIYDTFAKGYCLSGCYFSILTSISIIICYGGLDDIPRTQGQNAQV